MAKRSPLKQVKVARQAGGSVIVRCGETMVFAAACASPNASADIDFLPLKVALQRELFIQQVRPSAASSRGEGRPSERETLMSRLIDRPLRPRSRMATIMKCRCLRTWVVRRCSRSRPPRHLRLLGSLGHLRHPPHQAYRRSPRRLC